MRRRAGRIFWTLVLLAYLLVSGWVERGRLRLQERADMGAQEPTDEMRAFAEKYGLSIQTYAWQDDWVELDGKVYSYNRNIINILFLGIDREGGVKVETDYSGWKSGQADAVFILSINPDKNTMKIIGIPRNAMVDLEIYGEDGEIEEVIYNQLCLQYPYAGGGENGIRETVKDVSEIMHGLPVHGTVAIGVDAIPVVNDMLGGVEVEVLEDLTKWDKSLVKGKTVHLMGNSAYYYLRRRDIEISGTVRSRYGRHKQYLLAMYEKAKEMTKKDPLLIGRIYQAAKPYLNTDMGADELMYLAGQALTCRFDMEGSFYQIDGQDERNKGTDIYGVERTYVDLEIDEDTVKEVLRKAFYEEVVLDKKEEGNLLENRQGRESFRITIPRGME